MTQRKNESRESFFVTGRYIDQADGAHMTDQMYVHRRARLAGAQASLPLVMIHGGGQTAMNFETTPDGRPGWAEYFVSRGFTVYLPEQPARGRSAYHHDAHPVAQVRDSARRVEQLFTAPAVFNHWRQSSLHSQWPGSGRVGDPTFDQFFASQVPWIQDQEHAELLFREAGARLLDEIGPAVLLTHSQSGPFGWLLADARPDLVRAIVAIEPNGPPFFFLQRVGAPDFLRDGEFRWPYGITATAIEYDPPLTNPVADLKRIRDTPSDPTLYAGCHLQAEPARRLVNLAGVPVFIVTGQASYHASYDHCTVAYLRQAGVEVTHCVLEHYGILGNGHMMMIEQNNEEIAQVLYEWLLGQGLAAMP
jgi:pimeloyl-ACP methyl ester carboxylesterase